jgi:ABC-2 type transport system permease protein
MDILRVIYTIWYRETIRFFREKSRIVGMIIQPLLYLFLVGNGISNAMSFRAAPQGVNLSYISFIYPGIIGMSVLFTSVFSAVSIIWDREFGFLKEVLVAPVPRWAVALGKVTGIVTVVLVQVSLLLMLAPVTGIQLTLLAALGILFTASLMAVLLGSLGIALASRMESMEGFQMIMNFLVMPLFFLSGAMFPLKNMPAWMSLLMRLDPLTYGVDAMRSLVYGSSPAAAFLVQHSLAMNWVISVGLAALLAFLGSWSFNQQ